MQLSERITSDKLNSQIFKPEFILSLLNHKKHLIILSAYLFFSLTFNPPFYTLVAYLIYTILIMDGYNHGKMQIKKNEPTYFQVIQPIFIGILIALYSSYFYILITNMSGVYDDWVNNYFEAIPSIIASIVMILLGTVSFIIFPLIFAFMLSFFFFIPYFIGYQFGKFFYAKARRSRPNEMLDFLSELKSESTSQSEE